MANEKRPFVHEDQPTITVNVGDVEEYNKQVRKWCEERGIDPPEPLTTGTPTLCSVSSTFLTNTVNRDDHVDNGTDQTQDDSKD